MDEPGNTNPEYQPRGRRGQHAGSNNGATVGADVDEVRRRRPFRQRGKVFRGFTLFILTIVILLVVFFLGSLGSFFYMRDFVGPANVGRALLRGEKLVETKGDVLVVVAHLRDLQYWAGGTVAELADRRARVTVVVATGGRSAEPESEIQAFKDEEAQRKLNVALGVHRLIGLAGEPGEIDRERVVKAVAQRLRRDKPRIVMTTGPELDLLLDFDNDHRIVSDATL